MPWLHGQCSTDSPSGTWDLLLGGALVALWQCSGQGRGLSPVGSTVGRLDVTSHR